MEKKKLTKKVVKKKKKGSAAAAAAEPDAKAGVYIVLTLSPFTYRAFHKLPQIYTANHATFPIQMYEFTV